MLEEMIMMYRRRSPARKRCELPVGCSQQALEAVRNGAGLREVVTIATHGRRLSRLGLMLSLPLLLLNVLGWDEGPLYCPKAK